MAREDLGDQRGGEEEMNDGSEGGQIGLRERRGDGRGAFSLGGGTRNERIVYGQANAKHARSADRLT